MQLSYILKLDREYTAFSTSYVVPNFCLVTALSANNTFPYPTGPTSLPFRQQYSGRARIVSPLFRIIEDQSFASLARFPSTLVLSIALVYGG